MSDQPIIFMIKCTAMNLDNVLVHIADIIHRYIFLLRKKKLAVLKTLFFHFICVVVKIKIFEVFLLSCNDNNYMTYS